MEMIYDKDTNETVKIFFNPSHICVVVAALVSEIVSCQSSG